MAISWLNTGEGHSELAHEVVPGGLVIFLHHKTHQGQLRDMDDKIEGLIPQRVKNRCVKVTSFLLGLVPEILRKISTLTKRAKQKTPPLGVPLLGTCLPH